MDEVTDLIERLKAAPVGSRELDSALGRIFILPTLTSREYEKWVPPHYTTSLDAKLPGENIWKVTYELEQWTAWHFEKDRGSFNGIHPTSEAMARRIAALKAKGDG